MPAPSLEVVTPSAPSTATVATEVEVLDPDALALKLEPYSDGRLWDSATVVTEILAHTENMLRSAYEVGRRLLWTKEILSHGQFEGWCEAHLPFSKRTVENYMRIGRFFVDHPGALRQLAKAGVKKTLLLTTLPEDDLEELLAGGQIADADLTDLADVPYLELKREVTRLREAKAELETKAARAESDLAETRAALGAQTVEFTRIEQYARKVHTERWAEFGGLMDRLVGDIHRLGGQWDEIQPADRAQLIGMIEAMRYHVAHADAVLRSRIGEEVWGADYAEALQGAAAVGRPIPEDHQVLYFDDARTPSNGKKG